MTHHPTRFGIAAVMLFLTAGAGFTQQTDVEEELEPLERYQVEIIAFAYADGPDADGELLQRPPNLVALPAEPEEPEEEDPAVPTPPPPEPRLDITVRFQRMLREELQLDEEYGRLRKLSAYNILVHGGWTQEGVPEDYAESMNLRLVGAPRSLEGTLTLHKSRFLHVTVDLTYDPGGVTERAAITDPYGTAVPGFTLQERRRLRSGELHYFDHPAFGLLVMVSPEPVPDLIPETEAEGLPPAGR